MERTPMETDARSRLRRALDRSPFEPYSGATADEPRVIPRTRDGFSGTQAAKVVGISFRQLDYWVRTGLVTPSVRDDEDSGTGRRFSYRDLLELRVIKTLLDAGIKLESVREVFEYLRRQMPTDISSAHLVISGNSVVLARENELIDVLNKGQGVLNVLSLEGVKDEIDAQLIPLDIESAGV